MGNDFMAKDYWVAHKWSDLTSRALSLDEIKKLHQPEHHYRFSQRKVSKNDNTCSVSTEETVYIFKGQVEFVYQEESAEDFDPKTIRDGQRRMILNMGEYGKLPQGMRYIFNLGDCELTYLSAFKLPDDFIASLEI